MTGPCIKLPLEHTKVAELGEAAFESLEHAGAVMPHRTDWENLPPSPILIAAGVKSWATFSKGARSVELERLAEGLQLTPTERHGRQGYLPLSDDEVHLPTDATAEALCQAIQEALARCR